MHRALANPRPLTALTMTLGLMTLLSGCDSAPREAATPSVATPPDSAQRAAADSSGTGASLAGPEVMPALAADVMAAARARGGRVTVINLWATWCGPCREEFPDLLRLEQAYRPQGLRLVLVSTDFDDQLPAVKRFLVAHGVTERSYLKTGADMAFINGIEPRWSGALPATLVLDAEGRVKAFWEGRATYARFESEVKKILGARAPAS